MLCPICDYPYQIEYLGIESDDNDGYLADMYECPKCGHIVEDPESRRYFADFYDFHSSYGPSRLKLWRWRLRDWWLKHVRRLPDAELPF